MTKIVMTPNSRVVTLNDSAFIPDGKLALFVCEAETSEGSK